MTQTSRKSCRNNPSNATVQSEEVSASVCEYPLDHLSTHVPSGRKYCVRVERTEEEMKDAKERDESD